MIGGSIAPKIGLKKALILFNILSMIACSMKLVLNFPMIMMGRFLFGFCTGVQVFIMSKTLNDTVPPEHINFYGSFVNSGFCLGYFVSNAFGILLP
jgi:MFS family permease